MAQKSGGGGGGGARNSGPLRALVFFGIAVAAGSSSLVVLWQLIQGYQDRIDEARRPEDTVMVIVAARDLYQGVTITEEDLYAVEIPPRYLPEGVFLSPEHVVGRIPRERILANEFVRNDRLADPESGVGLNAVIPRGMRAISIRVSGGEALSGFLNPGNYVDVLVTLTDDDRLTRKSRTGPETQTLLQAIFVLGVNSRASGETYETAKKRKGGKGVTLLVTADQAEKIAHAERTGNITLTLRNDLDVTEQALAGVDMDDLRGKLEKPKVARVRAAPVAAAPKEETRGLVIIRGDKKTEVQVGADGVLQQ